MFIFRNHCIAALFYSLLCSTSIQAQLQKIYLNPKTVGSAKQAQLIDSIRFIPLELKEGIDLSKYNYVTITEKNFLIIDYPEKTILVYAKNGTFLRKMGYRSLGENLSPSYNAHDNQIVFFGDNKNYALTSKDRIQIMLDWSNPRNKKYFKKYIIDLGDATFSIRKDSPNENDILHAHYFYDDYYWRGQMTTSELFKDSLDYELKIYKNNQLTKAYFPYNPMNEPRYLFTQENISINSTNTPGVYLISRPFCDTIYQLTKESLTPAYQLVLPLENSIPSFFYTRPFKNKTERENFTRNNGWMLYQVYNFYESPKYIYFGVRYFSNYESYVYVKQTQLSYKTKNIKADSTQYNLNLLGDFNVQRSGDRFYTSQKAGDVVAFFESHKNVAVPKELEDFLKSKPNSNAPVIIEFKFKN